MPAYLGVEVVPVMAVDDGWVLCAFPDGRLWRLWVDQINQS